MDKTLFTINELTDLATPYPDLILKNIQNKNFKAAKRLCEEMKNSQILLHDFYAESCTILWSWVGENLGEETVDGMFRYIFEHSARRQFFDAACAEAPSHLSVILLAKSWRAHSCFEAGEFPGKFSIHEDDEKFTFRLDPCGSGLRLWKKGFYLPQKGGKVSENARTWTYNRKGFPYYCIHCPFLNELLPYESQYGSIMWPVDPPDGPGDICCWHIYKDRNDIPDKYYDRLGIEKLPVKKNKYLSPGRMYFSKSRLFEMSRPLTDRIIASLDAGEMMTAKKICKQIKDEFLVLHDLYVNMLVSTFSFIIEKTGEQGFEKALRHQFNICVREQLCEKMVSMNAKEKVIFLARCIFGTDLCNGSGYNGGRMKIFETKEEIVIELNPCGSGGRLLRAGAYGKESAFLRFKKLCENSLIVNVCRYLRFPEKLLECLFPVFVNHFTQRKPSGQAFVKNSHSWSFDKPDTPNFCCQCGLINEKYFNKGIVIIPPKRRNEKCVWKINKRFLHLHRRPD
jgi:hypothetical protein